MKIQHIYKPLGAGLLMILLIFRFLTGTNHRQRKDVQEDAVIKEAVDAKSFVFKAQTIVPMSGMSRQLNANYDLDISSDKIISFLPYMGRIYTPPIDPAAGPLRFTSTDFDYAMQPGKKGGWQISIKPKDVRSVREFTSQRYRKRLCYASGKWKRQATRNFFMVM